MDVDRPAGAGADCGGVGDGAPVGDEADEDGVAMVTVGGRGRRGRGSEGGGLQWQGRARWRCKWWR